MGSKQLHIVVVVGVDLTVCRDDVVAADKCVVGFAAGRDDVVAGRDVVAESESFVADSDTDSVVAPTYCTLVVADALSRYVYTPRGFLTGA